MQRETRIPDVLLKQIRTLRNRLIGVSIADGIGILLFAVSLNLALVLLLDWFIDLPQSVRVGLMATVPAVAMLIIAFKIFRPLLRRYDETELAAVVEMSHPELRERLLSVMELEESASRGEDAGSPLMRKMLMQQTVEFAKSHQFADAVDASKAVRHCWMGGIAVFSLMIPLIFANNASAVLLARFFNPWGNHERLQNLMLVVDNADRVVGRGDDVQIIARPTWTFQEGQLPESAWIEWTNAGGATQSRRLDWNPQEKAFAAVLARVESSFHYQVSADGSRTRVHQIQVVDRPEITRFVADITPPSYTGEPATHLDLVLAEVTAIERSRVQFEFSFNKPVASVELLWFDGEMPAAPPRNKKEELVNGLPVRGRTELQIGQDRTSATLDLIVDPQSRSGRFAIRVLDEHGLNSKSEALRRLTILPDLPPVIEFADNEQHASARPEDFLRIPLRAADDFGISAVELHYELIRNGVKESGMIAASQDQLGQQQFHQELEFDLNKLNLKSGMQITLRARAADNRPVPGPNESWTGSRMLQILDDAKPYGDQTLADQQHRMDQAMDNLKSEIAKERQAAKKLQDEAKESDANQTEWKGEDATADLEDEIRKLSQQMQKLSAILDQQPIFEPLAEKVQQIAEKELAQAAAKADEANAAPMKDKAQKLADAAEKLQKAESELQKVQEQHQSMAQMQRDLLELNRLAENTEQLAEQVDQLIRRRPEPPAEAASPATPAQEFWNLDHMRLVTRHQQLEKDLDKVLADHPQLLEQARENLKHQLASLGESADQLARQQQGLTNLQRQKMQKRVKDSGILKKQDELLREQKKLAEQMELPATENQNVNGLDETRKGREFLEQGNTQESQARHDAARQQLENLAAALKQNENLSQDPQEAVKELQERQKQLAERLAQIPDEATSEAGGEAAASEMARLAAEQAALQRAIARIPQAESIQEARKETIERSQEAGKQLAENRPAAAKEQAQKLSDALQNLSDSIGAAMEDAEKKGQFESKEVQDKSIQEQQRDRELFSKAESLIENQKSVSEQISALSKEETPSESAPAAQASQTPTPNADTNASPPAGEMQPGDLAQAQHDLAEQSRLLGDAVRQLALNNPEMNRTSHEFPNVARAADHELGEARFERAAKLAQEAAEKSQKFSDSLSEQQNGTIPDRLKAIAQGASQQQAEVARQLQSLAQSPEQQTKFLAQRQEQIRQQTEQLGHQLEQGGRQLGLKQMDRSQLAELAQEGQAKAGLAAEQMQAASEKEQAGNRGAAMEQATKSSESLRQAAELARKASDGGNPHRAPENPAQGVAGQQVAESAQHLNQAGEQLAQLGQPRRSSENRQQGQQTPDENGQEQAGEQKDSESPSGQNPEGQQQQNGKESSESGEQSSDDSQASKSLREAAQNMRKAAEQMGLAKGNQKMNSQNQQAGGKQAGETMGTDASDTASSGEVNLEDIDNFLGKVSGRNWGKLPGTLQTELIESSQRQRDAAYGGLIRRYFEDISKARPPQIGEPVQK